MSQACVSVMLVLPIMGNNKVQSWGDFQWHNIHTEFHQNSSCSFPGEACRKWTKDMKRMRFIILSSANGGAVQFS